MVTAAIVSVFERLSLPWNMSFPTLLAAEAALDDTATLERNVAYINQWLGRFADVLRELGARPLAPAGNFLLTDAGAFGRTTKEIYKAGVEAGVITKTVGPVNGREGYFRVTPGTEDENERTIAFFRSYFQR